MEISTASFLSPQAWGQTKATPHSPGGPGGFMNCHIYYYAMNQQFLDESALAGATLSLPSIHY